MTIIRIITAALIMLSVTTAKAVTIETETIENSLGKKMELAIAGSGSTAIILAHQYKGSWKNWKFFIPVLVKAGYKVYAFDFNGYGSNGSWDKKRMNNHLDIAKVMEYAKSHGASKLALMGSSMGAAAVLKASVTQKPDAVVAMAPYHQRGNKFSSLEKGEPAKLNIPVYLFTAEGDSSFKHAKELHQLISNSSLYVAKGKAHGYELLKTVDKENISKMIMEFLDANL